MNSPPAFACSTPAVAAIDCDPLLGEFVDFLRQNADRLQTAWIERIFHARLLAGRPRREIAATAAALYQGYVAALSSGGLEGLREFLRHLPDRLRPAGIGERDALGLVYLLRDVVGRSLFRRFRHHQGRRAEAIPQFN